VTKYAAERFIEVVLEIDTPAHTLAVGKSHPEMMTDCWEWMANSGFKVDVDSDDTNAMDPTSPAARAMVRDLILEAAALTPNR
jgi:N-acetyl-beta-hexosaminidase